MLTAILTKLREAETAKDEAKQNWLSLQREGDASQHVARSVFLQRDDEFSAAGQDLKTFLEGLRNRFKLNAFLRTLDRDVRGELTRVAVMLQLDGLLIEQSEKDGLPSRRSMSFIDLVVATRNTHSLLRAARKLNDLRVSCESIDEFDDVICDFDHGEEESTWEQAVDNYRTALQDLQGSDEERMAQATHDCLNNARRLYDHLIDELTAEVQERRAYGGLQAEMKEMEFMLLRYLRGLIEGGVLGPVIDPDVEPQAQAQPEARPVEVAVIERTKPEEETDARMPETDEEVKAAVEQFLKGLNLN